MKYEEVSSADFYYSNNENGQQVLIITTSDDEGASRFVEALELEVLDAEVVEVTVTDGQGNEVCATILHDL